MKKLELVFIPLIAPTHLTSTIQFAKLLIQHDQTISSITFLIILLPNQTDIDQATKSVSASEPRIRFIIVPPPTTNPLSQISSPISVEMLAHIFIESHKSQIEQAVTDLVSDDSRKVIGFVLDMFCTSMIDVANKFNLPSYIMFTSNICFLGFLLHVHTRHTQLGVEFNKSDPDSVISTYRNPVPVDVLPNPVFEKIGGGYDAFVYHGTRFKETKGFIVNSFVELEPYAFNSISTPIPVYPVGPLLDHKKVNRTNGSNEVINWLDKQPPKSVIFLCFGSMGCFSEPQLEQMAIALEKSNQRFLWSVRKPPPDGVHVAPTDYTNVETVLPDGFLERVKERGMVCGWAPQVEVLAHGATKGFVTHCGWNSILEGLWHGVPMATWPLSAEQQLNAFLLVKELGLGVDLCMTYRSGGSGSELVMAGQIEKAINWLMDDENPVRNRVKEISEKSRKALKNGGSSFIALQKLAEDMLQNID
ncbi:anthocyanidin 3-O-glucosyltransferase 2-like [Rutidosis leptorrhynchoides]|uniref:anthocyanidin 3-O-glucosyltransferase 2-like n=1 Tax=Rutidosis leptorrhynchoides TaxID=125765 RepID=UPI003A999352